VSGRYLVTGGAGFIGSHLVEALVTRGGRVVILDDLSTGRRENVSHLLGSGRVELVEGSTLESALVDDCIRSVDGCFHLASAVGVGLILENPLDSLLRTVRGSDVVMSVAARHGRPLLFTSTSEIYGNNKTPWLTEASECLLGPPAAKSRWLYSTAKAFGECAALGYFREQGLPTVVARLFNAVGARQTAAHGMVLPRFIEQALAGEDLTVYGDGRQTRCFCHVVDVVDALLRLADCEAAVGNVYNVGSSMEVTIVELAHRVIERLHSDSSIRFVRYDEVYDGDFEEPRRGKPDTAALCQLTGWRLTRTIEDAIDDLAASSLLRMATATDASVAR